MSQRLSRVETHVMFGTILGPDVEIEMNMDINTREQVTDAMRHLKTNDDYMKLNPRNNKKKITINGLDYPSVTHASDKIGIDLETLVKHANGERKLHKGNSHGIESIVYKGKTIHAIPNPHFTAIVIDGNEYAKLKDARDAYKIGKSFLAMVLNGQKNLSVKNKWGIREIQYKGKTITAK